MSDRRPRRRDGDAGAENVAPGDVLLDANAIADIVARLGREISRDYEGRNPILVNLLKGGVIFMADLIRRLTIPHQLEFMNVSSYEGADTVSSGNVRILEDLSCSIEGRDILVVEDVIDTGTTLAYIRDVLQLRHPKSIEICTLLRKDSSGQAGISVKYVGRDIPDVFVVGYGLDYDEQFRNLPHIAQLDCPA